jgi:hypothetical protein
MAQIKADEITQLLREQIANYDSKALPACTGSTR